MDTLINLLSINHIAFELLSYQVSYLELVATIFGLISVYLATKEHVLTWPTGIVNEWGFFLLFFQVQLYADMFLQVVFFIITLYGWYHWKKNSTNRLLHSLGPRRFSILFVCIILGSLLIGLFIGQLHELLPLVFKKPAAHPFLDSFVAVTSIVAITLLARKALESWLLWILVDIISIGLFYAQGIYLVAIEYTVFLAMATYGFIRWRAKLV